MNSTLYHFPGGQDCVWLRLLEIPFLEFNLILGQTKLHKLLLQVLTNEDA